MLYSPDGARIVARLKADLPQGVILTGPEGIGLRTAAADIAGSLTKNIMTLGPDEKGTIGIDEVRGLYAMGRSKGALSIFIIDDADAMGREAQNALLKLLEEPAAAVRFILTSHAPERLLPTVRSRVAAYAVTRLSTEQSTGLLDTLKVTDPTVRAQLLFVAGGLPAALTRYATTPKDFTQRAASVRDARGFLQGSREDRLLCVARYKERTDALRLVGDMLTLLRQTIASAPKPGATDALDRLLGAAEALSTNASVRLTLTGLALEL